MLAVADFDKLIDKLFAAISPEKKSPSMMSFRTFWMKKNYKKRRRAV